MPSLATASCAKRSAGASLPIKILAPLRGVTIRCFRQVFAAPIREYGFTEAFTPFIPAMQGVDPAKDRELKEFEPNLTVQFIGKDPAALRAALRRIKALGYRTADLNAGCPFPMVRNKGRGSGLLKNPAVLEAMVAAGCEEMGEGNFSVKTRLGVERPGELLELMPIFNRYPLRFLTVHPRTAKAMYSGECDLAAYAQVAAAAEVPLILNGPGGQMIGRPFIRSLAARADIQELLGAYIAASEAELFGERPVLGRLKELVSYWQDHPYWAKRWPLAKLARTLAEFCLACR